LFWLPGYGQHTEAPQNSLNKPRITCGRVTWVIIIIIIIIIEIFKVA